MLVRAPRTLFDGLFLLDITREPGGLLLTRHGWELGFVAPPLRVWQTLGEFLVPFLAGFFPT